jgi:hypothetical protein
MELRKPYPTDLNDYAWDLITRLLPEATPGGRPHTISHLGRLSIVTSNNGAGTAPYSYAWTCSATMCAWPLANGASPVLGLSLASWLRPPEEGHRDVDAHKQVKRRKRHLLVGMLGLILAVATAARGQDRDDAKTLLTGLRDKFSCLRLIWTDQAHAGSVNHLGQRVLGVSARVAGHRQGPGRCQRLEGYGQRPAPSECPMVHVNPGSQDSI